MMMMMMMMMSLYYWVVVSSLKQPNYVQSGTLNYTHAADISILLVKHLAYNMSYIHISHPAMSKGSAGELWETRAKLWWSWKVDWLNTCQVISLQTLQLVMFLWGHIGCYWELGSSPRQLGICGTALVANTLSHPVQIGTIDAHGTQQQVSSIHQWCHTASQPWSVAQ